MSFIKNIKLKVFFIFTIFKFIKKIKIVDFSLMSRIKNKTKFDRVNCVNL